MTFFKRFFWETFLRPDWYLVAMDGDLCLKAAYWNGVCWENRVEIIYDDRIDRVMGRIPAVAPRAGNDNVNGYTVKFVTSGVDAVKKDFSIIRARV